MPPKTRRRAAAPSQTTLSFNSKVTKPSQSDHISSAKSNKKRLSDPAKESIVEQISTPDPESGTVINLEQEEDEEVKPEPVTSPIQPRKKNRISGASSTHSDPREAAADKVTDAQIKKYWQKEEESRLAPRVHQKDLPLHEKILRHFDLSGQYGSCIGITRLARWKRANGLGLEPPLEVLAVLIRELEGGDATKTTQQKKKGASSRSQGCSMVAYIDELGGGRVGVVDA